MTFNEAIHEVITHNKVVTRRSNYFERGGYHKISWSEWVRIRMWGSKVDTDALIYIETNNYNEENKKWLLKGWKEDQLSKADVLAEDWEITEE